MSDAKKSMQLASRQIESAEQSGWSSADRDSWVTMAMAAATKSLRAVNLKDTPAEIKTRGR